MRKISSLIGVFCLAFLILLAGCYEPGGPVPEGAHSPAPRDYTQQEVDQAVVMDEQVISSPLPDEWGAPDVCDEIHFLRFRLADGSTLDPLNASLPDPVATDAMLVMIPGGMEGANGFEYLARQLIYIAKTQDDLNFEVWAVERRNNRLEDVSALNFIEDELIAGQMTMQEAVDTFVDYYYEGQPIGGRTFDGWYVNEDLPFLSEFGLQLDTEDVFQVILTMIPDPEVRREKVFVGGHSMGGIMTSMFVGWDLDGDPSTTDDAGYNNCAGIFGLDTSLEPGGYDAGGLYDALPGTVPGQEFTESDYIAAVEAMRDGTTPVILNSPPLLSAESNSLLEAIALAAYFDPDAESTYTSDIPWSDDMKLLLGIMHSHDIYAFMLGVPEIRDFRYTNEAMFGNVFDDSFAPVSMIQNSMGFLEGGPVVEKDFPAWPLGALSSSLSGMLGEGPYFIANDAGPSYFELGTGPLYSWVNFDEIGDASDPDYADTTGETTYTTMENEVADIHDVARVAYRGPTNLVEWYFSMRLLADFRGADTPFGPDYGLNFLYGDEVLEMPQVLFVAGQGTHTEDEDPVGIKYVLEGYNHMDVLTASANTTARRPNGVIRPLIDFVAGNL